MALAIIHEIDRTVAGLSIDRQLDGAVLQPFRILDFYLVGR
jgi:hypothetical protein